MTMRAASLAKTVVLTIVIATQLASCKWGGCDAVGCESGVKVLAETEPVTDVLTGSAYRVDAAADGKPSGCEIRLPEVPECSDGLLSVQAALNPKTQRPGTLVVLVDSTPQQLHVEVRRDSVLIGQADFAPTYKKCTDCDGEHMSASPGTVVLAAK